MGGLKHQKAKRSMEHLLDWTYRSIKDTSVCIADERRDRREVNVMSERDVFVGGANVHRTIVDQVPFPQPVNCL